MCLLGNKCRNKERQGSDDYNNKGYPEIYGYHKYQSAEYCHNAVEKLGKSHKQAIRKGIHIADDTADRRERLLVRPFHQKAAGLYGWI